ncbi:hypothetical protein OG439_40400 [Amycolatopsis sp. NBC_01307]|uniref:NaeI family type II restriction endonuclease n=1 Tax=Amycolatopsis sp. NBC_01307 TaxID=2903561 RepID=UPI002E15D8AA|nr:hypothetical protein OG439_40400 [Amycolatopsis sp. NBC_01307]
MVESLPGPGDLCQPDARKAGTPPSHEIKPFAEDDDLRAVYGWLRFQPIDRLLRDAVDDAIRYVLDGPRTFRFDLMSAEVDRDERSSVGTKLQYHVIQRLELLKEPPLDTKISDIPVEIKGTVRGTWMIPSEGQCEITLMIQINAAKHSFRALLMRTHRAWLTGGKGNRDLKRSPRAPAVTAYALEVVPWTDLPPEPLRKLTDAQLRVVFSRTAGLEKRMAALFGYLPEIVIPRATIDTVGATLRDPARRARAAKSAVLEEHDLVVLVGTWSPDRAAAAKFEHDITDEGWVAIPRWKLAKLGYSPDDFGPKPSRSKGQS